jgi:hypothetical protein
MRQKMSEMLFPHKKWDKKCDEKCEKKLTI